MATKGGSQKNQVRNPMKTKTGKDNLFALNIAQLNKLLESTQKPKRKAQIGREISRKEKLKEKNHVV